MRERGTQSRRAKSPDAELATDADPSLEVEGPAPAPRPPTSRATRPPGRPPAQRGPGAGYWPAVAIIAIVVATAGWTTVAVMALNDGSANSAAASEEIEDPDATFDDTEAEFSDEPVPDSHEVPALEVLLPTVIAGTPLAIQSWTGDTLLSDDSTWSQSISAYLTGIGKTPADLQAAQAIDPNESIDHSVGVFQVTGVPAADLRDALIAAWKNDYPELVVSTLTLDGMSVTKGDFGEDAIDSYWYEQDGMLYDVETSDEAVATQVLAAIRDGVLGPTSSGGPSSAAPDASGSPAASEAPAASASPS